MSARNKRTPAPRSGARTGPGASGPPLQCPWCPVLKHDIRRLNVHIGMVHKGKRKSRRAVSQAAARTDARSRTRVCPVCNYEVANATGLSHHMRAAHGVSPVASQAGSQSAGAGPLSQSSSVAPRPNAVNPALATPEQYYEDAIAQAPFPIANPSLTALKQGLRVLPRIPQGARAQAARKYTQVLGGVIAENDGPAWQYLLEFAYRALNVSADAKAKPLATCVKDNVSRYDRPLVIPDGKRREPERGASDAHRASAAEYRLAAKGDLRGAIRLLSSSESLVPTDDVATQQEMIEKHPAPQDEDVPPALPSGPVPRHCSADEIEEALGSFPSGSSGGTDGLTAQHLLDLLSVGGELRRLLLVNLSRVCDIIARGLVPVEARDLVYGSWLVAALKPSGGLRPIAIGGVLRRLTAKVLLARVRGSAAAYLCPRQLGFATRGGAEIAIHATRSLLEEKGKAVMLKVDFKNAFNSHRRDTMLKQVHERVPELYAMVSQGYEQPTPIAFGSTEIRSRTGCQQGDVFSPLLFCLTVHGTLESLQSELALGYLDDFTLISEDPRTIAEDIRRIQERHSEHGLEIQPAKCEVYTKGFSDEERDAIHALVRHSLPGCRVIAEEKDVELLGAPLFEAGIRRALHKKSRMYETIFRRLAYVGSHVACYILQKAAGVPRLTYLLRTSPAYKAESDLRLIDDQFTKAFETVLKISLSKDALLQLSLPTSSGGMGIPIPSSTALAAFAASCCSAKDDVRCVLGNQTQTICCLDDATEKFANRYGGLPSVEDRHKQSQWTMIASECVLSNLRVRAAENEKDAVRLAHISMAETGCWLQAMPMKNVGTMLTDREFTLAAGLRLGLPIAEESPCPCGATADPLGHHRLSCRVLASGRLSRHNAINDLLSRALKQAGAANAKEPRNLSANDSLRPDGLTHGPWSRGLRMIWDVTVRDAFAQSYASIAQTARAVVARGEQDKMRKYQCLSDEYVLIPFVIDTTGVWGNRALELVKEIGSRIAAREGDKRAGWFVRQRISIEVQRGNARMIMASPSEGGALSELNHLCG